MALLLNRNCQNLMGISIYYMARLRKRYAMIVYQSGLDQAILLALDDSGVENRCPFTKQVYSFSCCFQGNVRKKVQKTLDISVSKEKKEGNMHGVIFVQCTNFLFASLNVLLNR